MNPEIARRAHPSEQSKPVDVGRMLDEGRLSPYQARVVALIALSIIIDGIDSQLLGIVIPVMATEWAVPRTAFASVVAAGFVGMMVGGAIAGVAGDRLGRRLALIASVLLFGVSTVAASRVDGLLALGVMRFFIGIGLQGASPNAAALVAEYVPLRHRALRDHGDHRVHPPRCDGRRPHRHSCPADSRLARAVRDRWFAVDRHLFQFDALPSGIASLPRAAPRALARTGPRTPAHGSQAGIRAPDSSISPRARPRAPP